MDFPELFTMMARKMKFGDPTDAIKKTFACIGKHGDGYISLAKFSWMMTSLRESLTEGEVQGMIRASDFDGDGQVCFLGKVKSVLSVFRTADMLFAQGLVPITLKAVRSQYRRPG